MTTSKIAIATTSSMSVKPGQRPLRRRPDKPGPWRETLAAESTYERSAAVRLMVCSTHLPASTLRQASPFTKDDGNTGLPHQHLLPLHRGKRAPICRSPGTELPALSKTQKPSIMPEPEGSGDSNRCTTLGLLTS